jgi:hypothetical protein
MARCRMTKANGEGCKGTATGAHGLCWAHAPENAEQRRRGASRGGKAKASGEIRDLKKQLEDLARDVLAGTVERGNAVVVNQILNTRLRLADLERRQEAGGHNLTREQFEMLIATSVDIVRRHLPELDRFRAFSEEIGALLDEDSG